MFLSESELRELTGAKHRKKQTKWLNENGFVYRIGTDRAVKVLASHVESVLNPGSKVKHKKEPDFSFFEA